MYVYVYMYGTKEDSTSFLFEITHSKIMLHIKQNTVNEYSNDC